MANNENADPNRGNDEENADEVIIDIGEETQAEEANTSEETQVVAVSNTVAVPQNLRGITYVATLKILVPSSY